MSFGLSLAGGGIRGAAHVGVLKALEEEGIKPAAISGASAGSIVAGLYAAGVTVKELEELILYLMNHGRSYMDINYRGIIKFIPQMIWHRHSCFTGLIRGNRLMNLFCTLTQGSNIADIPIKLVIPAVDLYTGRTIAFSNAAEPQSVPDVTWDKRIPLCEAMIASSSIPAVFCPRPVKNYLLVDGGLTNNLPVNLLRATNETNIIAVDIGAPSETFNNTSIFEVITHSFSIMSHSLKECTSVGETLLLQPKLPDDAGILAFDQMEACLNAGYDYTKKKMRQIKKII